MFPALVQRFGRLNRLERVRVDRQEEISAGLAELAINLPEGSDAELAIESALVENISKLDTLSVAGQQGEILALSLARRGQLARKAELEREVLQVRQDLSTTRNEIEARQKTGELVSKMINGLRNASSELVEGELVKLEPLLQRIYSTADPHPEFRIVRLLSRMRQGRGRVLAEVEDPTHGQRSDAPRCLPLKFANECPCRLRLSRLESGHTHSAAQGGNSRRSLAELGRSEPARPDRPPQADARAATIDSIYP